MSGGMMTIGLPSQPALRCWYAASADLSRTKHHSQVPLGRVDVPIPRVERRENRSGGDFGW